MMSASPQAVPIFWNGLLGPFALIHACKDAVRLYRGISVKVWGNIGLYGDNEKNMETTVEMQFASQEGL